MRGESPGGPGCGPTGQEQGLGDWDLGLGPGTGTRTGTATGTGGVHMCSAERRARASARTRLLCTLSGPDHSAGEGPGTRYQGSATLAIGD